MTSLRSKSRVNPDRGNAERHQSTDAIRPAALTALTDVTKSIGIHHRVKKPKEVTYTPKISKDFAKYRSAVWIFFQKKKPIIVQINRIFPGNKKGSLPDACECKGIPRN